MTIPRLDGWWDEINRGGAAEKFVGALDKRLRPDAYAQQALQEMIRQNPNALEQIANMDPGQRQMFAATMGFTKGNPFENLAPGAARTRLNEEQAAIAALTPEQQLARQAAVANVPTTEDILFQRGARQREVDKFNQDLETGRLNIEVLTNDVSNLKRTEEMVKEGLSKYGTVENMDISTLVRDFVRNGQPIDPLQALVISQHPGAAPLFDMAYKLELSKMESEARAALARLRDPNEGMLYLRSLTETGNQLNDAEARLLVEKAQWESNPINFKRPWPAEKDLQAVRSQRIRNSALTNKYSEKMSKQFGIDPDEVYKQIPTQDSIGPGVETEEQRRARLRALLQGG